MNLGLHDRKKLAYLGVLAAVAGYFVYSNLFSEPEAGARGPGRGRGTAEVNGTRDANSGAPAPAATQAMAPDIRRAAPSSRLKSEEFRPVFRTKRKEDQPDLSSIDPTLHMELLAKVQEVKLEGGQRNLFQFGPVQTLAGPEPKIALGGHLMGPMPVVEKPPEPAVAKAPELPLTIPYKYYGLSTKRIDGKKTAFILDGEEIILATEGSVIKKRYKVISIGATSVQMEEVDSKRRATLTFTEDAPNASGG